MAMKERLPVKVSRPRISGIVERERLFRQLDKGRHRQLIWVSGPAGAGKTTLIASYLDSRKIPCLWYQLDEGDADLATFFYYLGHAARKAAPHSHQTLPLLTPEYLTGLATFSKHFFETLGCMVEPPFLLIFDNYQDIPVCSALHEVLKQGLSVLPEGVVAVIISRTEPLPAFARLTANNAVYALATEELRFTERESRELLETRGRGKPSKAAVAELIARTQGWAAGLVLFIEMTRNANSDIAVPGGRPPEEIFHYFAGEVFDKADPETQRFLLDTSLLPDMTVLMAERLSGLHDAGRILNDLTRKNFFIFRRPGPEPRYQYHRLFREFLYSRAHERFSPDEIASLRKNAAVLLEESGRVEDAVELFRTAKRWDDMVRLVCRAAPSLLAQGRFKTLLEWIDDLPVEMIEQSAQLLSLRGSGLAAVNPPECRRNLEQALERFKEGRDRSGIFLALSGLLMNSVHEAHDFRYLDGFIAELDGMLREEPSFPSAEIELQATMSLFSALALRQPQHPDIDCWEERAFRLMRTVPDRNFRIHCCLYLAVYHLWSGNTARASLVVDLVREDASSREVAPLALLSAKATIALYEWMTGDCERAINTVANALALADANGIHLWDMHLLGHSAAAALSMGALAAAEGYLRKMSSLAVHARRIDIGYYQYLSAWHQLINNDTAKALEHVRTAHETSDKLGLPFAVGLSHNILAQIHYERGEEAETEKDLSAWIVIAANIRSGPLQFMHFVFQAHRAFDRAGRETAARRRADLSRQGNDALKNAFSLGRERGIFNAHSWRPKVMARLCVKALEAGIETDYVRRLVHKRRLVPDTPPVHLETWPWAVKIGTLGGVSLSLEGKPPAAPGKARNKPLDMLKALVALGGKDVPEHALTDALWPDAEGDLARRSFDTTLHRLRKLLGNDKAIRIEESRLSLDPGLCWVDAWAFERMCGLVEERILHDEPRPEANGKILSGMDPALPVPDQELAMLLDKAISIYRGHFLPADSIQPWTMSSRERLKARFLRLVVMAGTRYERAGAWEQAKNYFQKGIELDDLVEEFHQHLMSCCGRLGQYSEAVSAYQRCRAALTNAFGVAPSPRTEEIYAAIRAVSS